MYSEVVWRCWLRRSDTWGGWEFGSPRMLCVNLASFAWMSVYTCIAGPMIRFHYRIVAWHISCLGMRSHSVISRVFWCIYAIWFHQRLWRCEQQGKDWYMPSLYDWGRLSGLRHLAPFRAYYLKCQLVMWWNPTHETAVWQENCEWELLHWRRRSSIQWYRMFWDRSQLFQSHKLSHDWWRW